MAQPLTTEKREELFKAFASVGTVNSVAKTCRVSPVTVMKYREVDHWDRRVKAIRKKAAKKVDNVFVDVVAENLKLVRFMKGVLVTELKEKVESGGPTSRRVYQDLAKVIALENDMIGERGREGDLQEPSEFDNMTVEELLVVRQRIVKATKGGKVQNGSGRTSRSRKAVRSKVKRG